MVSIISNRHFFQPINQRRKQPQLLGVYYEMGSPEVTREKPPGVKIPLGGIFIFVFVNLLLI